MMANRRPLLNADDYLTEVSLHDTLAMHLLHPIDKPAHLETGRPVIAEVLQLLDNVTNPGRLYVFDPVANTLQKEATQMRFRILIQMLIEQKAPWIQIPKKPSRVGRSLDYDWTAFYQLLSGQDVDSVGITDAASIQHIIGKNVLGLHIRDVVQNASGEWVNRQAPQRPHRYFPQVSLHEIFVGEVVAVELGEPGTRGRVIDMRGRLLNDLEQIPIGLHIQGPYGRQYIELPGPEQLYFYNTP
jgi:hypothetical protein